MERPFVSLDLLALWLSWPSIVGEFGPSEVLVDPAAPSADGRQPTMPGCPSLVQGNSGLLCLRNEFTRSLRRIADGRRIAVSLSGGLDSFAVLDAAVQCGLEPVIFVCEMVDDSGQSNVPVAERLAHAIRPDLRINVLRTADLPESPPGFDTRGPHLDAAPQLNHVLADRAAAAGCELILTGSGSDEALGTTRFLTSHFLRHPLSKAFRSYVADSMGTSREALLLEPMSTLVRIFPRRRRASAYVAASWPELIESNAPDVVSEPYRSSVRSYAKNWLTQLINHHEVSHSSWADMEACDSVWPIYELRSLGPIPFMSPYLQPDFLEFCRRIPLQARYDGSQAYSYWRQKCLVLELLSKDFSDVLPKAKATYSRFLTSRDHSGQYPELISTGLITKCPASRVPPLLRIRLDSLEAWLTAAKKLGLEVRA